MLEFEAFNALIVPYAYRRGIFSAAYTLRKTAQDACYFVPQSVCEKIIVNMVVSDHGIQDTVVRVIGPWEVESEDEHGVILTTWNLGLVARVGANR